MGNPAMGGGDKLQGIRDRLNAVRMGMGGAPSPSTPPLMMGPPPGLVSGIIDRPEMGRPDIGRSPQVEQPIPQASPQAPPPPPPGVISNILKGGGYTGRATNTLPEYNAPNAPNAISEYNAPASGAVNNPNPGVRKKPRNKAFTMPAQANKGMMF